MQRLQGTIAAVTGASRGGGRGIALALGDEGATVYVTGRTVRGKLSSAGRPETIEETAEMVSARGGVGIPVKCDHTVDAEIESLFHRVKEEQGRLDLLVNNAWGGYENYDATFDRPFWEQPISRWDKMLTAGVRSHLVTARFALPLMLQARKGLIINTTTDLGDRYGGGLLYYVAKNAINHMIFGMAEDLRPYGIAAVALAPGFMRTEVVLEAFQATEDNWQTVPGLERTETPFYIGRAVAALASDPEVFARTGQLLRAGDLAPDYGFTDVDGRQPPRFDPYAE